MAHRRWLTLAASAAALVLLAPGGSAAADPGKAIRQPHGHSSRHAHGHGHGSGRAHTTNRGPAPGGALDPNVRPAYRSSEPAHRATRYRAAAKRHPSHLRGRHPDLGSHPGKALGLFKHAGRPGTGPGHHPGNTRPPAPPVAHPAQTPLQHRPARPAAHHHPDGSGTPGTAHHPGSPATRPPPPDPAQAHSLARLLLQSKQMQFTALPLLIVAVLALCIGGLIRLARHRA
ncbi:MAG: hypothetical protein QOH89_3297 [Pseudonocardiales bacterium]|jgi:hypothetical protein|nr:hypothetical protein [Pseudonocardiales bacterium]MDT4942565.1 hypothetical protein [Pseudonocardiales bacterium]